MTKATATGSRAPRKAIKTLLLSTAIATLGMGTAEPARADTILISTIGNGTAGFMNGSSSTAEFNSPNGVGIDSAGNVYIGDVNNNLIRLYANGTVSTFAGIQGTSGSTNGNAIGQATFGSPFGIFADTLGNIFVADRSQNNIRQITSGVVSTLAGGLNAPTGVTSDSNGHVYVANSGGNDILSITAPGGVVTTFAGTGAPGFTNGPAIGTATFDDPQGVTIDSNNNVYVADAVNNAIRKIAGGTVSTLSAGFNDPVGISVDTSGNVYVTNSTTGTLQKVTPGGAVTTLTTPALNTPFGVAVSTSLGLIYVANSGSNQVFQFFDPVLWNQTANPDLSNLPLNQTLDLHGALTVTGTTTLTTANGHLTLQSGNTFNTGSLSMDGGTLEDSGNSTIAAPISITANNGTFTSDAGDTFTLSGGITGTGTFTKTGSGTLVLSGNSSYGGTTSVQAGDLQVNGSITSNTTVSTGATLSGTGVVLGSVSGTGTVAPGNSPGTLTVATYVASGLTLQVALTPQEASLLQVLNGPVNVTGGTVTVVPTAGAYTSGSRYPIFRDLAGAVIGTFTLGTPSVGSLRFSLNYSTADYVYLIVENAFFSSLVRGGNAGRVAEYLDHLSNPPIPGTAFAEFYSALELLPASELRSALNQLTATANVSISTTAMWWELEQTDDLFIPLAYDRMINKMKSSNSFREEEGNELLMKKLVSVLGQSGIPLKSAMAQIFKTSNKHTQVNHFDQFPQQRELPQSLRTKLGKMTFWIQQAGQNFKQKHINDTVAIKATSYGTNVGADYLCNDLLVGAVVGYSHNDYKLHEHRGAGDVNGGRIGLYTAWTPNEWYVNGAAFYGLHKFKGHRNVSFPGFSSVSHQKHDGNQYNGMVEIGRNINLASAILTPYISPSALHMHEQGYRERGGNPDLRLKAHGTDLFQGKAGVQLSKLVKTQGAAYFGFVNLGYTYRTHFNNKQRVYAKFVGQTNGFTTIVKDKGRNLFNPGLGFTAVFNDSVYLTAQYTGELSKKQLSNEGLVRFGWSF